MDIAVKRFDFSSGVASMARPSMIPAPNGEYCLYSEACATIKRALETQVSLHEAALTPQIICGHKIWLDDNGRAYTYCMFKLGHEGECK